MTPERMSNKIVFQIPIFGGLTMKRVRKLNSGDIINYAKEKFVVLGEKNGGVHVLRAQSGGDRCAFGGGAS